MREFLKGLTSFPHRGSATNYEEKAAGYILEELKSRGFQPDLLPFRAPSTYSWELIIISLLFILGLTFSLFYPGEGTILTALGLFLFVRHFTLRPTILSRLLSTGRSQNIFCPVVHLNEDYHNLILVAHYDSARPSFLFSPAMVKNFRSNFLTSAVLGVFSLPWCFLSIFWGNYLFYRLISLLLIINFTFSVLIHLHREIFYHYVNGANDNASGCAVIHALGEYFQKNRLGNLNLYLLFTGSEETGTWGAINFIRQKKEQFPPEKTYIINFDNVGSDKLCYATGEGMLIYYPYEEELIDLTARIIQSRNLPLKPVKYKIAYLDTLPFHHQRYRCITLISFNQDGIIPNWHWKTDTIEHINFNTLSLTFEVGKEIILNLDRKLRS